MNRSPMERLLPQLMQMWRAGGATRWIAVAIVAAGIGLVIVRPDRLSPRVDNTATPRVSDTADDTANVTAQRDVPQAAPTKRTGAAELGRLTPGPSGSLRSPAGLIYARGSQQGHRIQHVMGHTQDEPNRPGQHGVFATNDQAELVALLDEAYTKSQSGGRDVQRSEEDGRRVLTIDMGRVIGYVGGQVGNRRGKPKARHIRLVLEDHRVITAFPLVP